MAVELMETGMETGIHESSKECRIMRLFARLRRRSWSIHRGSLENAEADCDNERIEARGGGDWSMLTIRTLSNR